MTSAKGWRKRRHWVHRKMVLKLWLFTFFLWEGVAILQSCTHCQMSLMIEKHNLYIYINAPQPNHIQDCASFCCWLSFIFMTSTVYHHLRFVWFISPPQYIVCTCILTVWVFIRQPVVLVGVDFRRKGPSVALLFSWIAVNILTLVGVAHLELGILPHAFPASVVRSGGVAGQRGWEYFALDYVLPLKP